MFKKKYQVGKKFIWIKKGGRDAFNYGNFLDKLSSAEDNTRIEWCIDSSNDKASMDAVFPAKDYVKAKQVISYRANPIEFFESKLCKVDSKDGRWSVIEPCAYRVSSEHLNSLVQVTFDEWSLLSDFSIVTGLVTSDDKCYVTKHCADFLEDVKKEHAVKVIKNCDKKTPPYYFVIAGETFPSTSPNYWFFLTTMTRPRDWMLEDGASLQEINKANTSKKTKKAEAE